MQSKEEGARRRGVEKVSALRGARTVVDPLSFDVPVVEHHSRVTSCIFEGDTKRKERK